eukprot:CAMPEP_0172935904 /NCGR_PEP_ID=MMETSP1075-20121228/221751_1 /TAXON_ID=2916 /ORGANISM="Ceratium fusus, Strain PA161109" /LENGTH=92 /DNA_ID=CAMNT_0013797267 /DNA_START=1179 /DNA_END=1457 /DNA_ORIENTATION=-
MAPDRPSKLAPINALRSLSPSTSSAGTPSASRSPTATSSAVMASNCKVEKACDWKMSKSAKSSVSTETESGIPASKSFRRDKLVQKRRKLAD